MDVADLFAGSPQSFPAGFFGTLDQATIGHKILYAREAGDILNLIQKDQGQNLSDAGDGLQPREGLHIMGFGTPRDIEFHLPESLIVVIDEGHVDFNGLAHARIREMLRDIVSVRFVG